MDLRSLPSLGGACNIRDFTDGISAALPKASHCNEMAKHSANKGRGSLANEVLQYFINHEGACDTVEGIVAWWLPSQRIEYVISEVDAVLRELVTGGLIIAREGPDGRTHYRMKPKKKQAIRRRLDIQRAGSRKSATRPSKA
jgi:hypothetical protein